ARPPIAQALHQGLEGLGEERRTVVDDHEIVARTVHFAKRELHAVQGTPRGRCNTSTRSLMSSAGSTRIRRTSLAGSSPRFHSRFLSRSREALSHHPPGSSSRWKPPSLSPPA